MKIDKVELVISAVSSKQYPDGNLPEIALAGRSNVGKSSFINKLLGRKMMARTSSKPGKTQTLNFYKLDNRLMFVDVPGYGYAAVSKRERAKFGQMIEEYLMNRLELKAVCLLTDSRHTPTVDDVLMYDFLKYHNIACIVVMTKIDKVAKRLWTTQLNLHKETLKLRESDHLIPFSAVTGNGRADTWAAVRARC